MKMNRNKGSLVAICHLDTSHKNIESSVYVDYSWVGHSPQDALVNRYPELERQIRTAKFCRWTPYFLVAKTSRFVLV